MGPDRSGSLQLDLKVKNDPVRLFGLIKSVVESYEGWQQKLAPRIVLGIWHVSACICSEFKRRC